MNKLDFASSVVFLIWCVMRLAFHVGSGNSGWSAAFGAATLLSFLLVISEAFPSL